MSTTVPCAGTSKTTGEPCVKRVRPPATVCYWHGGRAPQTVAAVERRRQEAQLTKAVQTYGAPIEGKSDAEVLADLIAAAYGHVAFLAAMIATYPDIESVPELLWSRYDIERTLAARMTKDSLGANVAERHVKLAEDQGHLIADVMRRSFADVFGLLGEAGVSVDVLVRIQREAVPGVVRQRLSEVMEVASHG